MSERKRDEDTSGLRSLTQLSAEQLLNSAHDLRSLDEHPKTILLEYLVDERRVHADERHELNRLRTQISRMPAADQEIYFGLGGPISPSGEAGQHSDEREEIDVHQVNGYEVNDYFLHQWEYRNQDTQSSSLRNSGQFSCNFDVLYRESQSGELRLCTYQTSRSNNTSGCTWSRCCEYEEKVYLYRLIASSTLLYRLVVAFGLPGWDEDQVDGYKSAWAVTLRKVGHGAGTLRMFDCKGAAHVQFDGDLEACKSALKLVTWLVGDNIAHSYDGILAGRIA
ncbi:uncharacterized protein E0L32_004993 [Thyridium curvatum]|uniref:Uncharacterized protein n=1 Tax=Thyridium curvatum TaxID=1093900 RepID=A0A507B8E6_9PEZI|nr:uncharacterized protein E0L32_004993 [Thyridium curvatum]TPX14884.1 hypothetical protein E0L32_004993 [Thyridium curvatum]